MNFIIFTETDFPVGGATTSRIKLISKCLTEAGNNITLAILNAESKSLLSGNETAKGVHDGIEYIYLSNKTVRPSDFIGSLIDTLRGILFSPIFLYTKATRCRIDAIILYTPNLINCSFCIAFSKLYRIPIFVELCEIQSKSENEQTFKQKIMSIGYLLAETFIPRIANGFIVISTKIRDFYVNKGVQKSHIFLLPIIVDFDYYQKVFLTEISILKDKQYFLYSGSFDEKDGLEYVIRAFSNIAIKQGELFLVLTGQPTKAIKDNILNLANRLNVSDKIKFTGFITNDELIWCYQNAMALICCRTNSKYANFGFPTKLGEYLSVGKPVVATKVGDIERYLSDEESVFFAEPENVESISQKMEKVLANQATSAQTGNKGRFVAKNAFDYRNYIYSLDAFIKSRIWRK